MADYNWDMKTGVGGFLGQENKPVSAYNGHQDKFLSKEGNDGQRTEETFQDVPERLTDNGAPDSGIGGPKSGHGASSEGDGVYDHPSYVQSQFGLEGTTGFFGTDRSDSHLGITDTSSNAAIDPHGSASDQTTAPDGDGWRPEDLTRIQGSKKHEMMNKIKEKLPGHHNTVAKTTDPKAAPKKGVVEKVKESLPGHHGNDAGM